MKSYGAPSITSQASVDSHLSRGFSESSTGSTRVIKIQNLGWKAFLLLQFQIQFEIVITSGMYLSYICSVIDFAFAFSTHPKNIPQSYEATAMSLIYIFDVIYIIDLLSMISYKNSDWYEVKYVYPERHTFLVLMDAISIIPLDAVYYSLTEASMRIIYLLRLRYLLRSFRLLGQLRKLRNSIGNNKAPVAYVEITSVFILALVSLTCLLYFLQCRLKPCKYNDYKKFLQAMFQTAGCITAKGFPTHQETDLIAVIVTITTFTTFFYIYGFMVGRFLSALKQSFLAYYTYTNIRGVVMNKIYQLDSKDALLINFSEKFFEIHWKNRQALQIQSLNLKMLPEITSKEISLDIEWDGLKHSHLFRDKQVHFLRYVSSLMKPKFLIPGEPIFKHNQYKSSMVYVVRGVIQILSVKDGETPILSFSGGTCIGESSLFFDYPSSCTVICKNYCEIHVLYRKDFLKVLKYYPNEYKKMFEQIKERYSEARLLQNLMTESLQGTKQERGLITLTWLKVTMEDLFSNDDEVKEINYKQQSMLDEFEKHLFCPKYLDMLVISTEFELVTDSVFLNQKCPCILQPESFVVIGWNTYIATLALVFAFVFPYYGFFQPKGSYVHFLFSLFTTISYAFDIYVIISTGVKTADGLLSTTNAIAIHKIKNFTFFLDVIAIMPFEFCVKLVYRSLENQKFVLLQFPKMLKFYRVPGLFDNSPTTYNFGRTYMKFTVYLILFIYYVAGVLYLSVCFNSQCDPESDFVKFLQEIGAHSILDRILGCIYLATCQVTLFAIALSTTTVENTSYVLLITILAFALLFQVSFLSNIITTDSLKEYHKLLLEEKIRNIKCALVNFQVNPQLQTQILKRIRCQIQYNDGIDLLYTSDDIQEEYLGELLDENRTVAFYELLKPLPLFQGVAPEAIQMICRAFRLVLFAPGEVITYAGEVCKELMYIKEGLCHELIDSSKQRFRVIGPGSLISAVETYFDIPVANTIVSLTHCKMLIAGKQEFLKYFLMFPHHRREIIQAVKAVRESINTEELLFTEDFQEYLNIVNEKSETDMSSFKHFGYRLREETIKYDDFHKPFDKMGYFGFVRYFFLRHAITSYGRFLMYWEIARCIFAFVTAIFSPVAFISTCADCVWNNFFIFLDVTAWLDIYIRHYVTYFDEDGIEITHPLKTAIHYWTHGFVVDFIGVFDINLIVRHFFNPEHSGLVFVLLRSIRIIQVYRILRGILFVSKDSTTPPKVWTIIKFLPILLLMISTTAAILVNTDCTFDPKFPASELYEEGLYCKPTSWFSTSKFSKPLTKTRTYLYGWYIATCLLLGPGFGGLKINSVSEAASCAIISSIGLWLYIVVSAKIVTANLLRNTDLTSYQETMRNLVEFLSHRRVDPKLKKEVIDYFEYMWRTKKGVNLHDIISNFNYALQEDILHDVYGQTMSQSTIFQHASSSFFRSLLLNSKHTVIMKRGIISKVNDVHRNVFFVLKGQVEVLGPDYNRLVVLPVGSLFGNIDSPRMTRQTLTMVAKGHVELITIDSTNFHKILSNYYSLKQSYRQRVVINTDYLMSTTPDEVEYSTSIRTIVSTLTTSSSKLDRLIENTKAYYCIRTWEMFVVIVISYFGTAFELYRMAFHQRSLSSLLIAYIIDILHIINIVVNFQISYEDEFGILVSDKKKIARRYMTDPWRFPLHVAAAIPFEITAIAFINTDIVWTVWNYSRLNRFIRIQLIAEYLRTKNELLNVNVYILIILRMIIRTTLVIQATTCAIILLFCINKIENVYPLVTCVWKSSIEQWKFFIRIFRIMCFIFTGTSTEELFPNGPHLILAFVIIIILFRLLFATFIAIMCNTTHMFFQNRVLYEQQIHQLKDYMIRERTSIYLINRVWNYLCLLWKKKRGLQFPEILEQAPYYLQEGVLNSLYGSHLRKHKHLGFCHTDLIRQMATELRPQTFFPGDYITFVNDIDECMYFIHEGTVVALIEDQYNEKVEMTLHAHEMFGFDQGLYLKCGHDYTYRACMYTIILVLRREKWIHLLSFFPASKEIIYNEQKQQQILAAYT